MKKLSTILIISFLAVFLVAGSAWAVFINPVSWDGINFDLQSQLDALAGGDIGLDASGEPNDAIPYDEVWVGGGGGSGSTFLIEITGNASINTFGIYDPFNADNNVQIFAGSATPGTFPGANAQLLITGDGSVFVNAVDSGVDFTSNYFGFYLGHETAGDFTDEPEFYSQSSLNEGDADHLVAFGPGDGTTILNIPGLFPTAWLPSEYILAWEDLYGELSNTPAVGFSDWDFNDMVVLVESVTPIPEPASMLIFGVGLIGLGAVVRKKFFGEV